MYHLIPNAILVDQVKEQGRRKGDNNPYTTELLRLEEKAKDQGLGCWSKVSI
jgi:staphylococcal nuclease domain-containing protein 1